MRFNKPDTFFWNRLIGKGFSCRIRPCNAPHFLRYRPEGNICACVLRTVPCGINACHVGFHIFIYDNGSICCQSCRLRHCDICSHTGGENHQIRRYGFSACQLHACHTLRAADFRNLYTCQNGNTLTFRNACQHSDCRRVNLACHQHRCAFQNRNIQTKATQRPSRLQPKHAAADDNGIFCVLHQRIDSFHICNGTHNGYLRQIIALDGRHKAMRAECIDALIEGINRAVCEDNLFFLRIQSCNPAFQLQVNAIFLIPFCRNACNRAAADCAEQVLGQHGAIIGQLLFLGKHGNFCGSVA